MRRYGVEYLTQKNDECVECYEEVEANDIGHAWTVFNSLLRVVQRVTSIKEISANMPSLENKNFNSFVDSFMLDIKKEFGEEVFKTNECSVFNIDNSMSAEKLKVFKSETEPIRKEIVKIFINELNKK